MLFFCVFAFFFQSISSVSLREQFYDILDEFRDVKPGLTNKEYPLKAESDYFTNLRYFLEIDYEEIDGGGGGNFTGFGQTWFIGSGNTSRSQFTLYANGNSTGMPFETITKDFVDEYVVFQEVHSIFCLYTNGTIPPNYVWNFIGTRFITPEFDDYGVIWGPRLVDLYTSASGPFITVTSGIDSFSQELVFFRYHYHSSDLIAEELIYVHDISHAPFNTQQELEVPTTVQCLDELPQQGIIYTVAGIPFPQMIF